ncbi:MAG TPA: hypothetical protein VFO07_05415, partial [Roseiflexaceae bacterium]|nr:hypothetical protein [Roseiflexaceae bacterium]
ESPTIIRRVLLDRAAPTGRALLYRGAAPRLEIQAQDDGSGLAEIRIDDGTGPGAWQPFQATVSMPDGLTSVQVRLRDAAGNVSAPISAQRVDQIYLPFLARP